MNRWLLFLLPFCLFADKVWVPSGHEGPWLTGPLLAPSSLVIPGGHANYEPYVFIIANTGIYDGDWNAVESETTLWMNSFEPLIQIGLTSWLDFLLIPAIYYNRAEHQANWAFGDLFVGVDLKLYQPPSQSSWCPNFKLILKENFPTGKYDKLDPKKKGTQIGGIGTFETEIGLAIGKLFHFTGVHFMMARLLLQYGLPVPTRLKGFNAYGGGYGTNARFFPAQNFQADFAVEITLAERWALACDLVGTWAGGSRFTGKAGVDRDGNPAVLGFSSSTQYSLAPAIEYNWSGNLGVIGGGWFTFAGRNATRFCSAVFALNYYK